MGPFLLRQITLISNASAGGGRAGRRARDLANRLVSRELSVDHHPTNSADEARQVVLDAVASSCECLCVAGGDGTIRNVLDLVASTDTPLAVLPSGRGNDFVRAIGGPSSVDRVAQAIQCMAIRRVDLGAVNGSLFATVAGCGLDAEVGRLTEGGSAFGSTAGYLVQAIRSISSFSGYVIRVEVDGRVVWDGDTTLVACANTSTYGGGFMIAPGADPTDGLLDVCVIKRVSRIKALSLLPQLAVGEHTGHPDVTFYQGESVRITSEELLHAVADGDVVGQIPLQITTRASVLDVITECS